MGLVAFGIWMAVVIAVVYGLLELLKSKNLLSRQQLSVFLYVSGLLLALFGLFFSWIWVYYGVLFYSLPALLASGLVTWRATKLYKRSLFLKINKGVIITSVVISFITFFIYLL